MSTKTKTDVFLVKALTKMFEMVGERYSPEFTKKQGWYVSRSWNQAQEDEFTKWLCEEIKVNLKVTDIAAQKEACFFVSNYGWKLEKAK
jgi:hypothetical protein